MTRAARKIKLILLLFITALIIIWPTFPASARMGGGHSYSGSRSRGSSRSSSSYSNNYSSSLNGRRATSDIGFAFDILKFFLYLHFRLPFVAIPIDILLVLAILFMLNKAKQQNFSYQGYSTNNNINENRSNNSLTKFDKNFSTTIFLDFVSFVFTQYHQLRNTKKVYNLSGYIDNRLLMQANQNSANLKNINSVIIANVNAQDISFTNTQYHIAVTFTANYIESNQNNEEQSYYTEEVWVFSREQGVLSRTPERICSIDCPACGSTFEKKSDNTCSQCGMLIKNGKFDWFVTKMETQVKEAQPLLQFSDAKEQGTNSQTIINRSMALHWSKFLPLQMHFEERLEQIFMSGQKAWSELKWEHIRPFVTDNLFKSYLFWIEQYKGKGYKNSLNNIKIDKLMYTDIDIDSFYTAITVRIFASMNDATIQVATNKVVSGSLTAIRTFSEYWTFIKSNQSAQNNDDVNNCPNCGALLKISMAGVCEYCKTKITNGNFDWVLSRIEQDDEKL